MQNTFAAFKSIVKATQEPSEVNEILAFSRVMMQKYPGWFNNLMTGPADLYDQACVLAEDTNPARYPKLDGPLKTGRPYDEGILVTAETVTLATTIWFYPKAGASLSPVQAVDYDGRSVSGRLLEVVEDAADELNQLWMDTIAGSTVRIVPFIPLMPMWS